jgi:hypothetical protein
VPDFTGTPTFPDVDAQHWALDYVEYAVAQGMVQGYLDGTYRPTEPVDRGQMSVFIARAIAGGDAGVPDDGCAAPVFPDVDCSFWARKYVQHIKTEGVTGGYEDGLYHPEIVVTRGQMAVYMARAFGLVE